MPSSAAVGHEGDAGERRPPRPGRVASGRSAWATTTRSTPPAREGGDPVGHRAVEAPARAPDDRGAGGRGPGRDLVVVAHDRDRQRRGGGHDLSASSRASAARAGGSRAGARRTLARRKALTGTSTAADGRSEREQRTGGRAPWRTSDMPLARPAPCASGSRSSVAGSWGTTVAALGLPATRRPCCGPPARAGRRRSTPSTATATTSAGFDLPRALRATVRPRGGGARGRRAGDGRAVARLPGHAGELAPYVRPWVPVVSLTKGLELGTHLRMTEVIAEVLPGHPVGVLTGPNLAKEILAGHAAAAVVAIGRRRRRRRAAAALRHRPVPRLHQRRRRRLRGRRGAQERDRHRRGHGRRPRHRRQHPGRGHHPGPGRADPPRRGHGRRSR